MSLDVNRKVTNTKTWKRELVTWEYLTYSKTSEELPVLTLVGIKEDNFVNDQLILKMSFKNFRIALSLNEYFETLETFTYKLRFFWLFWNRIMNPIKS